MTATAVSLTALLTACDAAVLEPRTDWGVIHFTFTDRPADTLQVLVLDPATVMAADAYLRTGRGPHVPSGPITRGAGLDPRWPFHFDAREVRLAELSSPDCDAPPMRSSDEVEAYFALTVHRDATQTPWCPSTAVPIDVDVYHSRY
ncbi:MAG TPA: hypothetical protein VFY16_13070 [Gemmatimonadaceae bacterium]|nr:hypothetical protein [Gemmatimonadaceae bacterium]